MDTNQQQVKKSSNNSKIENIKKIFNRVTKSKSQWPDKVNIKLQIFNKLFNYLLL